jgi:hypothetical protein
VRQLAQPIVNQRNQPIARAFVPCTPLLQEIWDLRCVGCHSVFESASLPTRGVSGTTSKPDEPVCRAISL